MKRRGVMLFIVCLIFILLPTKLLCFSLYQEDASMIEKGQLEIDNTIFFTRYTKRIVDAQEEKYTEGIKSYWAENYLDIWYGLSNKINARLILPYTWWSYRDEEIKKEEKGLGDMRLALKLQAMAHLFFFTGLKLNTGSFEKELGTGVNEPFLNIIYQLPFISAVDLIANLGWQYNPENKYSFWNYGIIINYPITEKLEICLESFLERQEGEYNQFSIAPAITYQIGSNFYGGLGCEIPVMTTGNLEEGYDFMPYIGVFCILGN